MFEKRFREHDAEWQEVREEQVRMNLAGNFKNVDLAIQTMQQSPGKILSTFWADFRWSKDEK